MSRVLSLNLGEDNSSLFVFSNSLNNYHLVLGKAITATEILIATYRVVADEEKVVAAGQHPKEERESFVKCP